MGGKGAPDLLDECELARGGQLVSHPESRINSRHRVGYMTYRRPASVSNWSSQRLVRNGPFVLQADGTGRGTLVAR